MCPDHWVPASVYCGLGLAVRRTSRTEQVTFNTIQYNTIQYNTIQQRVGAQISGFHLVLFMLCVVQQGVDLVLNNYNTVYYNTLYYHAILTSPFRKFLLLLLSSSSSLLLLFFFFFFYEWPASLFWLFGYDCVFKYYVQPWSNPLWLTN